MTTQAETAPAKKGGCLKPACLGCLCVLIAVAFLSLAAWHALSRWDRGSSGWEHVPPSAIWAIEGHDIASLLKRLAAEPALTSLVASRVGELAPVSRPAAENEESFRFAVQAYRRFSFLHPVLAPNLGLVGGTGRGGGEVFAFLKPPPWMRWFGGLPGEGAQPQRFELEGIDWYAASKDGWLILAVSKSLAEEIVGAWDAGAKPLGSAPGRSDAYLVAAYRTLSGPDSHWAGQAPAGASAGLMFHDPFAEEGAAGSDAAASDRGWTFSLTVLPDADGWSLEGEARIADANLSHPGGAGEGALALPAYRAPGGWDARLDVAIGPELLATLKKQLAAKAGAASPAADPPWQALGWLWLNDAWLARVAGSFSLLAAKPAAAPGDAVAPLPVFSLGWSWDGAVDPVLAGREFGEALSLWLDSLTGPGGPAPLEILRTRIHAEIRPDGGGEGMLELPAVLANHAKPAWRLHAAPAPGGGWLATDPAGLPAPDRLADLGAGRPAAPAGSGAAATAVWNFSEVFSDALLEASRERLEILSPEMVPSKDNLERILDYGGAILKSLPSGRAAVLYDEKGRAFRFKARLGER